jgi:CDP-diacylglycerol---serine O-phosphatidyltransferase
VARQRWMRNGEAGPRCYRRTNVPRAIWRRRRSADTRRTADSPRPAGRRWARLRRSGSLARRVFVGRPAGAQGDRAWRRIVRGRGGRVDLDPTVIAPLSPPMGSTVAPGRRPLTEQAGPGPVTIPLLPGERSPVRRFKFAVANGCTVASLLLGMSAVFLAVAGDFRLAALALLACVVFDGCDGGLARRFGVASPFGAQLDSLADLSSFGAATGVVAYLWLVAGGAAEPAAAVACALVAVCAAIRLARFNVSPKDGRFFCGIPTTMTAAVLALNILIGPHLPIWIEVAAVGGYALAMVTSFPYAKLVRVLHLPPWLWIVPAVCAYVDVPNTFAVIVTAYALSGPLLWLVWPRVRASASAR